SLLGHFPLAPAVEKGARPCRFEDHPTGQLYSSTLFTPRTPWSGIGGRHQPEWGVDVMCRNRRSPSTGARIMDRQQDWCVIICLIGGGQQINTGEAGLGEWLHVLEKCFPNWEIYISDRLETKDYAADDTAHRLLNVLRTNRLGPLHLGISMRS